MCPQTLRGAERATRPPWPKMVDRATKAFTTQIAGMVIGALPYCLNQNKRLRNDMCPHTLRGGERSTRPPWKVVLTEGLGGGVSGIGLECTDLISPKDLEEGPLGLDWIALI